MLVWVTPAFQPLHKNVNSMYQTHFRQVWGRDYSSTRDLFYNVDVPVCLILSPTRLHESIIMCIVYLHTCNALVNKALPILCTFKLFAF